MVTVRVEVFEVASVIFKEAGLKLAPAPAGKPGGAESNHSGEAGQRSNRNRIHRAITPGSPRSKMELPLGKSSEYLKRMMKRRKSYRYSRRKLLPSLLA